MLKFYFHPTPNPMKVALFLAETGIEHELVPVDTLKGEQHMPAFTAINPNAKLPAIEDDGARVFDSNAILLYLADKHDVLRGTPAMRGELLSWLMFVATGLGPYSGQAVHFRTVGADKSEYASNRYSWEADRHYRVLDERLRGREFVVGDAFSIVDIATWGWIDRAAMVRGDAKLDGFAELARWFDAVNSRPAVETARAMAKGLDFKSERDEQAMRSLFPSNYAS